MKNINRFPMRGGMFLAMVFGFLLTGLSASARRIYVIKGGPGDGGKYYNGTTAGILPGDTLVLTASQSPYAYFSLEKVNGTAAQPIVVINEGGQVDITNGVALTSCTYVKFTGTGSSDTYGFKSESGSGVGVTVSQRSANIEIDHCYFNNKTYGFWIKEEGNCDPQYQYPNWVMDNFAVHDNKITNMGQSGMYLGSTDPNGTRPVTCNGATTYPKPLRLGNFKVYNNIIDHTSRGAIQLSGAQYGSNEIYNNTISNVGFEFNTAQGNGIVLGGYTHAYVHHNNINYTYSSGIFSLGSGLVRIENNTINNSGFLAGQTTNGMSSIMIDTRETFPAENTSFQIKNNTVGTNTDFHVRIYTSYMTYNTDNIICANMPPSGNYTAAIANGIQYTGCAGAVNLPPTANAGLAQTIVLPVSSAQVSGTGLDPDGTIVGWNWTKVDGPAQFAITNPNAAQTTVTNLVSGIYTFRLRVTDNGGASATSDVKITVNGTGAVPLPTTYSAVPGKVESEDYEQMSGVQKETTSDVGGGLDVGYIDPSDWMDYDLNVAAAGSYTVGLRVASASGGSFQIRRPDGTVLATVNVPATGGWQSWQTVTATVNLSAGQQALRLISTGGGWNINWMDFSSGTTTTPTTPTTPAPTTAVALPGKIEAENWTSMSGVQKEGTSDVGGGENVGYIDNGDWMDYSVNPATTGTYTFNFRVASAGGGSFQLKKSDGTVLATVNVPNTGGWQAWQTVSASVSLAAGAQTLRLQSTGGGWNINWLEAVSGTTATTPPVSTGTGVSLPGKVEAENYTSMSGVQKESTSDVGGGENVGYIDNGDWMEYNVNPSAAGTYTFNFRLASASGGSFQLRKSDGTVLATVNVPNTGGWQNWQTISAQVTLGAGAQTLRLVSTGGGWNINWFEATSGGTTTTTPSTGGVALPGKIEAENYTAMSGVQKEGTSDVGGGENVGYIDNGDWMEYSVNPTTAATFNLNLRLASSGGGSFQVRKADGTVLATVNVPNTGGWQNWQTVTANVTLAAGTQTLRIVSTGGGWNINWMEFTTTGTNTNTTPAPAAGYTALPAKIEAENWSAMSGVQTENTSDAGGGLNVGYIDYLDWMEYKVSAATAGSYPLSLRIATPNSNAQLQVRKADGTVLVSINLPNTGGYQNWQTVTTSLNLPQGDQVLRIVCTGGGSFNINWLEFTSSSSSLSMNTTAVEEAKGTTSATALEIYPNPVVNQFVLKVNNSLQGTLKVEIVNIQGGVAKAFNLQKTTATAQQFYLSIGDLPQGQYQLRTTMDSWTDSASLIKQ